jgi:osmotically inducible lipoprotein OsmB
MHKFWKMSSGSQSALKHNETVSLADSLPSEVYVMKTRAIALVLPLALMVSACGDTWGQRAATGGGIGAGTGVAVGALVGWPIIGTALVGGLVGAGIGAATTPKTDSTSASTK